MSAAGLDGLTPTRTNAHERTDMHVFSCAAQTVRNEKTHTQKKNLLKMRYEFRRNPKRKKTSDI